MSGAIDMTSATKRLEPALRHLAKTGGHVAATAEKFKVEKADLWAWLGQFNHSRPSLAVHVIDGVLAGLANYKHVEARDGKGERSKSQKLRRIVERAAQKLPAVPAIKGPMGRSNELRDWLAAQASSPTAMFTFQVHVTPAMAAAWMTLNIGNRNPSRAKVNRFAAVMREGKWILNGETVKFSESGRLLDGQSRLQAIIEAGVPVMIEVRGGLPDSVQQTMDCGETRKATHALEMMGEENAKVLSPALRLIFKWETDQLGRQGTGGIRGRMGILENLAIKPMLERHGGLRASVAWAVGHGAKLSALMPLSEAAFFHYLFGQAHRMKRDAFFDGLRTGNAIAQPVALLRQRILEAATRLPCGVRIRLTVKAWNAFFAGRNLPQLTLAPRESVASIAGTQPEKIAV